jgi:hypothetical protein
MLEIPHLFKTKNIIILNEATRLIFEIRKGSLKINSSIIGNMSMALIMSYEVNLNSLSKGNRFRYLNGSTIKIPTIMSIKTRIRNEFHSSLRKTKIELIL